MPEDIYRRYLARLPAAGTASEGAPGNGIQILLNLVNVGVGQFRKVSSTEATACRSYETQQVLLGLAAM